MNYYKHPKKRSKSMSVYIILALCLVAIGVGARTVMDSMRSAEATSSEQESKPQNNNVNNIISDITYSSEGQTVQSSKPEQSAKPESSDIAANNPVKEVEKDPVANYFVLPVTGNIIKSFSGDELVFSNTFGDMRLHTGIDIAAAAGTAIKSAGDGVVESVIDDAMFGKTVVINHGNGIVAHYCGLSGDLPIKENDKVLSGTVIGSLGTVPCEALDESHLHFSITKNNEYVSPLKIMGMEE